MSLFSSDARPITRQDLPQLFSPRATDSNKGSFGTLGILGGGPGMSGSVLLAGRAALQLGAGKIFIGFAERVVPLAADLLHPELMLRDGRSLLRADLGVTAWTAGSGMGTSRLAVSLLDALQAGRKGRPLVLDADALNLLAQGEITAQWEAGQPVVLTPHPAEAGRLLKTDAAAVQADRLGAARELARRYSAWIVLKGAGTIIATPQGQLALNTTGNAGLATAGTGDVLAGMLGSLLAQRIAIDQAVCGAVWLHGAAADKLVSQGVGPIGLTAGELAESARSLRNSGAFVAN